LKSRFVSILAFIILTGCQSTEAPLTSTASATPRPSASSTTGLPDPVPEASDAQVQDQETNPNVVDEEDMDRHEKDKPDSNQEFVDGMEVLK
jgi:Tfp pilus assembly protein PilP